MLATAATARQLCTVYGKDEADDLTKDEKKELQMLAKQLIEELRERQKQGKL